MDTVENLERIDMGPATHVHEEWKCVNIPGDMKKIYIYINLHKGKCNDRNKQKKLKRISMQGVTLSR